MVEFASPPAWEDLLRSDEPVFADLHVGATVTPSTLADAPEGAAVIVGEPFDRGHIVGRPGARDGPAALREALANTKGHSLSNGPLDVEIRDLGDVVVPPGESNRSAHATIREATAAVHDAPVTPVFLGGDHSLVAPNVAPLLLRGDSVAVVNFDSHDDTLPLVNDQPHTASPFRELYEAGLDTYVLVGAREFGLGTESVEYIEDRGGAIVPAERVGDDVREAAAKVEAATADADVVYVTLDVDVFDMAFVPGTSSPYPGGLLPRELFQLVRRVATDDRVVGIDVVECSPILDEGDRTATNGGRAIAHFLSGLGEAE